MTKTIGNLARIVTSKNAGPYRLTIDVFFDDPANYALVRRSNSLRPERIAEAYGIRPDQVRVIRFSDAALGLKITIDRSVSADDYRSTDTYGAQQHMPIVEMSVLENA